MSLKEDLIKNNTIVLIISKKDITEKIEEINKVSNSNDVKVSIIIPSKATISDKNFVNFVHNIILQVRLADTKCLFLLTKEDLSEETKENLTMFADKLIEEN